ncbi:MAG: CPBP family intramembrane metalloprotease [Clostridia bacterium]|nr:CPBP family intramembrane metalloprotease [Clostridia bacterium]
MHNKKQTLTCVFAVIVACILMAVVDGIWQPVYAVKSAIKIVLFLALPFICGKLSGEQNLTSLFKANSKGIKFALLLGIPVYILILGGYLLLKDVFDFSSITGALTGNVGINRENFVFVAIYISFINSLLEEFFFRGFAFLTLKKTATRKFAYIFSSIVFALYHVAIMTGWFSVGLYILIIAGLIIAGLIFNFLNEKYDNIYVSWFVHMFANFAINTVGFLLFGIISV